MRLATTLVVPALAAALAACLLAAAPARAEDGDKARAKRLFQEGMAEVEAENYPAALAAFEESYSLYPKPALLFNIAMCEKALYRYVDSMATFRRYLEEAGETIKPAMRDAVDRSLAEMEKLVGKLRLVDAPEGAEVLVDGKGAGRAPLEEDLVLDPGQHTVQVVAEGFKPLRIDVTIASGAVVPLRAALKPVEAWLEVTCEVEGAVVRLDDEVAGGCPWAGEVTSGTHQLVVEDGAGARFEQTVDVAAGGTASVAVSFDAGQVGEDAPSGLLVGGIASLVAGAGAGVVGGVFHARGVGDESDLEKLRTSPDRSAYDAARDDLKVDQVMTITGYALAGALITTGVVLLVVDARDGEKDDGETSAVAVRPSGAGVAVSF